MSSSPPPLQALEALPEHLLLRVLRAWAAPLPTQLATLPRRMHAAIIAAAYASVDSSRSISLGGLDPQPFRCALRAVAALASMQRVDTITLAPPHRGSVRQQASECMGPMQLIARHLCPLVAITSLHLTSMPRVWLGSNNLRQLSCVTCMPHLRAVGVDDVKQSLIPALVATLARMPHLCELKLGVCMVPVVVDGGWGGAGLVRQLIVLTALEAVNLKLQYKRVSIRSDAGFLDSAAPLLRAVDEKRVSLLPQLQYFCWEGKRRPADVLGALCAAAPRLDLARCGVDERGEGRYVSMAPPAVKALWGALMTAPKASAPVAVHMLNSGISRLGMRVNPETGTIDVPPAALGDLPGLQHFIMQGPEERPVDGGDAAALGRQLYKLTQLTTLDCNEAKLGGAAARLLLPQLSALLALQELNLEGCCIGAEGGEALAAALPQLGTLRHLNLEQNDLGERGCAAVMAALASDAAAGMNSLRLGWNCIGLGGAAALAARLPEMKSLTELHLAANRLIGGEGVAALQGGLAARGVRLTALKNLELQRNFLECHGAAALAGMLPCFPKLESVCLQANAIGARGMRALAQQVGHMQRLERLDMSYNCVGDVGAQALAHMFRRTVPGRVVSPEYMLYDLEQNGIADAGALALAGALLDVVGCGSTAYHVRLQGNEVSAGMWNHIARRTLHVNRPKHRLALCQGGYRTDQTSPEEMHEMMAG